MGKKLPVETGGPYNIIVIDDDNEMLELLSAALGNMGYKITTAEGGKEAIKAAKKDKFHLAIVDLKLPDLGGIETIEEIRKINPDIEAIVITGYGTEDLASNAVERGAYAFIAKPFELTELKALLPGVWEKISLKSLVGLYEATRTVFADVRLRELLPSLLALTRKILAADDTSLMLMGKDGNLRIAASSGLNEKVWKNVSVPLGESVAGRVAQWKTGVTIKGSLQSDPRFADLPSRMGVGFSLVYPILLKNELVGILSANRREEKNEFLPQDLRHAAFFCAQIAQAIENAKLYESLEEARKEAVEANALKDEFLHITTHDLKSPLNTIRGYAELLLEDPTDDTTRKHSAQRIIKATDKMLSLVHQVLWKGQIETAKFKLEKKPAPVADLVEDSIMDFDLIMRKRGINLLRDNRLPSGYEIAADHTSFQEIVSNLLTNAINACDSGGEIKVALESENGSLILGISDTGPGIPPEEQGLIFERFQRGTSVKTGGTGYGLAIVKRLVELHDGRVELTSSPGKGSTFRVLLPE